jgi:prepilin-type N-terminal cleavage/methylation domain-containing protein
MTISATGERRGFTLLEILLALALIALLATLFIGASTALLNEAPKSADDLFWAACQTARKTALMGNHDVLVSFDPKQTAFVLDDGVNPPQPVPLPNMPDMTVNFVSAQKGGSTELVGGDLISTQTIPNVTFYTDGTCSPFKVQFRNKVGAHILEIDPWTCAPVLPDQPASP